MTTEYELHPLLVDLRESNEKCLLLLLQSADGDEYK